MPKRVLIIGILFCLVGTLTIWDIILDFIKWFPNPIKFKEIYLSSGYLGAFLLPIGIGLLRQKPASQKWAKWLLILIGCLNFLPYIILAITAPKDTYTIHFFNQAIVLDSSLVFILIAGVLPLCIIGVIFWLLHSSKTTSYLNSFNHSR